MTKNTSQKKDWYSLLEEQEGIKPEAYVLYLRRSKAQKKGDKEQYEEKPTAIDNLSLDQHREACRHVAERRGLKIDLTFEEEVTAKKPKNRPEFQKMMDYIQSSPKQLGILAWAPDRLSRNAIDAGELLQGFLEKVIIDFQFATYHFTQDETGIEYLMMEFARAMGYSLRLRKNVLRGMHRGYFGNKEWMFGDKFGYKRLIKTMPNGERKNINFLIPYEKTKDGLMSEFEAVQMAFELRLNGLSAEEIASKINAIGYLTKKGKIGKMDKQRLLGDNQGKKGLLKDTFYYGLANSKWGEVDLTDECVLDDEGNKIAFTPAVLKEDFGACQRINERRSKTKTASRDYLPLRGQLKCDHCESTMTPQIQKGKYVYYYCQSNEACPARQKAASGATSYHKIAGKDLFPQIQLILSKGFKLSRTEFTRYLAYLEKQAALSKALRKSDLKGITARKSHIQKQQEERLRDFERSITKLNSPTKKLISSLQELYEKDMARLEARYEKEQQKERLLLKANHAWTQKLTEWLEHMQNAHLYWRIADLDQKRILAEKVFLELVIKNGKVASYSYNEPYSACEKIDLSYYGGANGT